ncbi:hydrolethalus syndrome protein 1 isoform X2 [Gouania willdenowi]|uniref:hydrolethalus syndrome protein 1 isoform X2 n=1 Tax=Gouania willdenowi TaxID=441366 RepID=UPI0010566737|nr:hydrolethalus syndrome protein 1 isoform X2 [Gouania willdenowi]
MVDNLDFTEEEIQEQLEILGYKNIPKHRLLEFKQDLDDLIQRGEWMSLASPSPPPSQITPTSQPDPPAYIKEKVSLSEAFFQHPSKDNDTWVPAVHQNTADRQHVHRDLYAQHSVAQRLHLPPGASSQLQVEPNVEETLNSTVSESHISSPDSRKHPFIKRKVLRKQNGQMFVCDESIYSEDSASCLEERLSDLQLSPSAQEDEDRTDLPLSQTSDSDGALSAFESYMRGMTRTLNHYDFRPKPKSFIRPIMNQQTIKKSDPVARYFQYKQLWDMFKCPGEADRRALRWEIKEQLAYQPPPPKPHKVLVPNTYIVPTEKKRSELRWEVRNTLANRIPPYKFRYPF